MSRKLVGCVQAWPLALILAAGTASAQTATGPAVSASPAVAPGATASTPSAVGASDPGSVPVSASQVAEVNPAWVVKRLLASSMTLQVAGLNRDKAREVKNEQDGIRPYTFEADAGYTRTQSPALSGSRTVITESNSVVVGSQLSKTYASGTVATVRAEGERFDVTRSSAASATSSSNGVGYQATVRAEVSQPLLSGYGSTVNDAGLRAARIDEVRLEKSYVRQSSELVRDALKAYWELWYAGRNVEIQHDALLLAISQQREADAKVAAGALSPSEALKFRTQVATLNETWLAAQATERAQALTLGEMLGAISEAEAFRAALAEPEEQGFPSRDALLTNLEANSPALGDLKEALRLAQEKRKTAGDSYRARLDLDAWVEATGLGRRVGPAMRRLGNAEAVTVYGGITYQTSLDSKRLDAARAQADYDVRIAESNLRLAVQQLQSETAQLLVKAEQAKVSLEAAKQTLEVAAQQANNERQRFALGAATPLDIQVAEESLREAQLRVVRAKADRMSAWLSVAHASGELVKRYDSR